MHKITIFFRSAEQKRIFLLLVNELINKRPTLRSIAVALRDIFAQTKIK